MRPDGSALPDAADRFAQPPSAFRRMRLSRDARLELSHC